MVPLAMMVGPVSITPHRMVPAGSTVSLRNVTEDPLAMHNDVSIVYALNCSDCFPKLRYGFTWVGL